MREIDPNLTSVAPERLILRCLKDREMCGHELVRELRGLGAVFGLGEGVVYPLLHALEHEGALQSRRKSAGGRSRVYYAVAARDAGRLSGLSDLGRALADAIGAALWGKAHAGAV